MSETTRRGCLLGGLLLLIGGTAAAQPSVVQDTSSWVEWKHAGEPALPGSALDMSFLLEAPAGRRGFVSARGDQFVFEDGTVARFYGGNFFGEANFPDKADAERLADIVARSGANLVRLHHLDVVAPWTDKVVQRSLFGGQSPETTRRLDPAMLDRFEYLVHCLKQRGVYVFVSHLSSRNVRPGDGFPGPNQALADLPWGLKVEGMFDPYLISLQQEYLQKLLTHKNPYTGLALVEDPVMVMTEVVNENALIWPQEEGSFATSSEYYRGMLQRRFNAWLREKVADRQALVARWAPAGEGRVGLGESEDPGSDSVTLPAHYRDAERSRFSEARIRDSFRFLADLQWEYLDTMRSFLKDLGLRCPLTGSNHWTDDVIDLQQNARFDYVDRHTYWTHPEGTFNYEKGQGIDPKPMVKDPEAGNIGSCARRRVYGRPYTVSEWHNCLPNPYRAEGTPIMAAYAALNGWHPMHYAYWGTFEKSPAMINSFEVMLDPTQTSLIPSSALLFLRADVRESPAGYYDLVDQDLVVDPLRFPERHPAVALVGKYGLAFPDQERLPVSDPRLLEMANPGRGGLVRSGTGELSWDATKGLFTIDTPRTQGVVGFVGQRRLETRDVTFELDTPFGVVLVSSLTDEPLATSSRLLVATAGDARLTGVLVSENGDKLLTTGRWPFLMQPLEGRLSLAVAEGLTVYRLATNGQRLGVLAVDVAAKRLVLPLEAESGCLHYEIVRD
jgi:hypothetical protein